VRKHILNICIFLLAQVAPDESLIIDLRCCKSEITDANVASRQTTMLQSAII